MTTDFRALCAELLEDVRYLADCVREGDCDPVVLNDCLDHAANASTALSAPEQGPTEAEVADLAENLEYQRLPQDTSTGPSFLLEFARAVLTRWGRPAVELIPVARRLPGLEDLDAKGRCWWLHQPLLYAPTWVLKRPGGGLMGPFIAWAPHWALPLPQEGE